MKVETPQIRWHQIVNPQSKKDHGANGPILSCSSLRIPSEGGERSKVGVLATAGSAEVNLWRIGFTDDAARRSGGGDGGTSGKSGGRGNILVQPPQTASGDPSSGEHTQIEHVVTLSRGLSERGINAVTFSPSGRRLVAAGDGGVVVVWTLPSTFVNDVRSGREIQEGDLKAKVMFNRSDDVMDVAWSPDSRRFVVCSLDHTSAVWESSGDDGEDDWKPVHRSTKDHTNYVQGVAWDPKSVYLASMGSDRTVKVYARKGPKETAVRAELAKYLDNDNGNGNGKCNDNDNDNEKENNEQGKAQQDRNAILQSKVIPNILANSSFTLRKVAKTIKFLQQSTPPPPTATPTTSAEEAGEKDLPKPKRHHLFCDELALGSFFRRPAFTPDGAFLAAPAGLWRADCMGGSVNREANASKDAPNIVSEEGPGSPTSVARQPAENSYATYLFARHRFDKPYKVLAGLEKLVRMGRFLRKRPEGWGAGYRSQMQYGSECNRTRHQGLVLRLLWIEMVVALRTAPTISGKSPLPYRSVFAVLTAEDVLVYDTYHNRPLAMARGLHYAGLTDAAWSSDGRTLIVTSSDGYASVLSFADGELGKVYVPVDSSASSGVGQASGVAAEGAEMDSAPIDGPKTKASDVGTGLSAGATTAEGKRRVTFSPVSEVKQIQSRQIEPVTINTLVPKKKKKKIVATTNMAPSPSTTDDDKPSEDKKRPASEEQLPTVNILVAKKKKKVAKPSALPTTT
ncbi:hypothetical protein ACHAWF_017196 [Thalassiosira exigua]